MLIRARTQHIEYSGWNSKKHEALTPYHRNKNPFGRVGDGDIPYTNCVKNAKISPNEENDVYKMEGSFAQMNLTVSVYTWLI